MIKTINKVLTAEGLPYPLGVSWDVNTEIYNFALYSKHANSVTLLFYSEQDVVTPIKKVAFNYLKHKSGRIWHCQLARNEAGTAKYYAYSVNGPDPEGGFEIHTFDADKVLLDVYAKAIYFPTTFNPMAATKPGSNAGKAPLGLLHIDQPSFQQTVDYCRHLPSELIIYEMHVKGFTRNPNSGINDDKLGTYAGVIKKIPYLKELGITAVELMPVFQREENTNDYWGYNPLSFFAPHGEYAACRDKCAQHEEFKKMVNALHHAGIDVILDVVYNHTCEGNQNGPTYCYKGIDNSTYYLVSGNPVDPYMNFTGAGNTLNCQNRAVRKMIVDSLSYWVKEMRIDGFRFDLASVFSRNKDGSINLDDPPIFGQISAESDLDGIHLIAEPWDAGGAYELGRSFPGTRWLQWNGQYRDTLQKFIKGDPGKVPDLMTRIYGSDDLFRDSLELAYRPYQSVNYITSHDGFTLYDLVSYNNKHNWANGENNTDGHNDYSWNCGWEGDEEVPELVVKLRKRQIKNFFTLLILSNGTPMFRAGDEFMQTQYGNNNPYNQDNMISWLDWNRLSVNQDMFRFFKLMIALRKTHPSISRTHFWRDNISWYGVDGSPDLNYHSHALAYCLQGQETKDNDIYVMINAYWEPLKFKIMEWQKGRWRRVVDTNMESPHDILEPGQEFEVTSSYYTVVPRSVIVLIGT